MRDVALQRAVKITAVVLTVMSAFSLPRVEDACAQDYKAADQIPRELMRASAKRGVEQAGQYGSEFAAGRKLRMEPLPGDLGFTDSAQNPGEYQTKESEALPDLGQNARKVETITLPPLRGLRQLLDSEVTKTLLKDLTVAKANVLMQTYMMVENGAATGFMGGMGIGSDLMSNMLQAQDAQMKMLDVVDDTGKAKEAYVRRVAHLLKNGDANSKNIWPAAIYMASGEDGKKPLNQQEMKDLSKGQTAFTFERLPSADDGGKKEDNVRLLSNLMFVKEAGNGSTKPYSNDDNKLKGLRKEFVKLVGDTRLELEKAEGGEANIARNLTYTYIPPEQKEQRRGMAAVNWEEVKVVWENIHEILGARCDWAKQNANGRAEVWKKKTFCSTKDAVKNKDAWELASSPDIPMTCNLAEQLFKYIEKNSPRELDCEKDVKLKADQIPEKGGADDGTNFNDCSGKNGCERKRVILNLAFIMARSRTLYTYQTLYTISKRFAVDPLLNSLVESQFERALSGMDVDQELLANRERYGEWYDYLSSLTKGQTGGGNTLRPGTNNLPESQVVGASAGGGK